MGSKRSRRFLGWDLLLLAILVFVNAGAFPQTRIAGGTVIMREPTIGDIYVAGRVVQVLATVRGDLLAAGDVLHIMDTVQGDFMGAGREIILAADIGDDVRAVGSDLIFQSDIEGHLIAAGRSIEIGADAQIGDNAWLAGDRLTIAGRIDGNAQLAGRTLTLTGSIGSDAVIYGAEIVVEDSARIGGTLTIHAEVEPFISDGADIQGEILVLPLDGGDGIDFAGLFLLLSIAATAIVLALLCPAFVDDMTALARTAPLANLGAGAISLFGIPALVIFFYVTLLGGYLATVLLLLYLLLITLGLAMGLLVLSSMVMAFFEKNAKRSVGTMTKILIIVFMTLVVWLVSHTPLAGGLVLFFVLLSGAGTLTISAYRRWRESPAQQ